MKIETCKGYMAKSQNRRNSDWEVEQRGFAVVDKSTNYVVKYRKNLLKYI